MKSPREIAEEMARTITTNVPLPFEVAPSKELVNYFEHMLIA